MKKPRLDCIVSLIRDGVRIADVLLDAGAFSEMRASAFVRRARRNDHHSPASGTAAARTRKIGFANLIGSMRCIVPNNRLRLQALPDAPRGQ